MPKLLVLNGSQSGEIIEIHSKIILSATPQEEIFIDNPSAGKIQAKIQQKEDDNFYLYPGDDILINGDKFFEPTVLGHGDFIYAGAVQLLFDEGQDIKKTDTQEHQAIQLEQGIVFTSHKTFTDADAIVNEMVQSQDQGATRRLASLFRVTQSISQVREPTKLFDELIDIIFLEFSAERCLILMKEGSSTELKILMCRDRKGHNLDRPQISQSIISEVIEKKSSVLTENALEDKRFEAHLSIAEHQIHSLIAVPLMSKHKVYGMIQLDTQKANRAFRSGDLEMLAGIAMQASNALEKFELEQVQVEKEKLEKELKMAGEIQRFLLPAKIPIIENLEIGLKYELSQQLGGDYYDFIDKGNGNWAFILADVSGHSTASALVMAMARTVLRNHCRLYDEPNEILEKSNAIIKEDTPSIMYLTAFLLIYNCENQTFTYSGAGHPFPLLQREKKIVRLSKGGRPLGLMKNSSYEQHSITLRPEDRILIYTDGITEAKNKKEENFGEERILRCLQKANLKDNVQTMIDLLDKALIEFIGNEHFEDDITLLALQQR